MTRGKPRPTTSKPCKAFRCAIYTRKSSDEGLEQGFNSLDAQREACAAYILSQASEGWEALPAHYDDGGISGGTLERPALQQLLADVAAGSIDIIVVYKVDRLTRSLLDFARLVEALDKAGTSFVSITQSFNTTTSMGRLTLNMLLSFAQFEREVTAERIRDKITASKAKGMWMGGIPPLGYRPDGRSLAIVEKHAVLIRQIYEAYQKLGNVRLVADRLIDEKIAVPIRKTGSGRSFGGGPFSRGQLYAILRNPIYAGDIPHRGEVYPGNHPAIIERDQWEAVQIQLASHVKGSGGKRQAGSRRPNTLAGLLFDKAGEPLIATHTAKGGQRYRYYVSRALHHRPGPPVIPGMRLPAIEIEQAVAQELARLLDDPVLFAGRAGLILKPADLIRFAAQSETLASELRAGGLQCLRAMECAITVLPKGFEITMPSQALGAFFTLPLSAEASSHLVHACTARLTRTGRAVRLVHNNGALLTHDTSDPTLVRLLLRARSWWAILAEGEIGIAELARQEGVTASWVTRVVRLAFLAPRVIEAIMSGRLKTGIDGNALMKSQVISSDWAEQETLLLAG